LKRTYTNDYEWSFTNVHERSRKFTNDCEWLWTFANVHERWTFANVGEDSNEGSRIRTSGSYERPELYNKQNQNSSKKIFKGLGVIKDEINLSNTNFSSTSILYPYGTYIFLVYNIFVKYRIKVPTKELK